MEDTHRERIAMQVIFKGANLEMTNRYRGRSTNDPTAVDSTPFNFFIQIQYISMYRLHYRDGDPIIVYSGWVFHMVYFLPEYSKHTL